MITAGESANNKAKATGDCRNCIFSPLVRLVNEHALGRHRYRTIKIKIISIGNDNNDKQNLAFFLELGKLMGK